MEVTGGRHPQEVELPEEWNSRGWPRGWNSQGGGTPRGGSPREVELPGGRRVELPGGGTRRKEFLSAGHLKTQGQIPMRVYIYIANLLLFIQCKEISANAQFCTEGKGFCLKCEAYFWHRS